MSDDEVQVYLAAALDQEACKATLTAALESRVTALQRLDISNARILTGLQNLCDAPYQMNDDVIYDVIELVMIASLHSEL